jgi:CheY-like chemotaxis protein
VQARPIQDLLTELHLKMPVCTRVLLVDDEFEVLAVLEALLDDDWDVLTAQSGAEALEILNGDADIDLVITDQRMPNMTGVELLQSVSDSHPEMYRMVLTAYSDVEPIVAAINQGKVDQFVLKPWDPLALRRLVAEGLAVCERRAAMSAVVATLNARHQQDSDTLRTLKTDQGAKRAMAWIDVWGGLGLNVAHHLETLLAPAETALLSLNPAHPARLSPRRARALAEDLSRLAMAKAPKVDVSPRKLISDAVRLLIQDENALPIHVDIDPTVTSLHVAIEPMRTAIVALLRNAVMASKDQSPIAIGVWRGSEKHITIAVKDQGLGMSVEATQQAASPFFSDFEPTQNGLGLYFCQLVAELHGGRLALLDNAPCGLIAQLWFHEGAPS